MRSADLTLCIGPIKVAGRRCLGCDYRIGNIRSYCCDGAAFVVPWFRTELLTYCIKTIKVTLLHSVLGHEQQCSQWSQCSCISSSTLWTWTRYFLSNKSCRKKLQLHHQGKQLDVILFFLFVFWYGITSTIKNQHQLRTYHCKHFQGNDSFRFIFVDLLLFHSHKDFPTRFSVSAELNLIYHVSCYLHCYTHICVYTIEFFTIGISVRLSDRSLHREEQNKILQKLAPVEIETRTSGSWGHFSTNWAKSTFSC